MMSPSDPTLWRRMRRHCGNLCRQALKKLKAVAGTAPALGRPTPSTTGNGELHRQRAGIPGGSPRTIAGNRTGGGRVEKKPLPPPAASTRGPGGCGSGPAHDQQFGRACDRDGRTDRAMFTGPARTPPGLGPFDDPVVLRPDYCFDQFVTGPGNRLAYAASVAVADQPGKAYNPLFIHGGVGLGKTHLLQAICHTILQAAPEARLCYVSCDGFMNRFIEAVQQGKRNDFRNLYRHVDVLLIDDIRFLSGREAIQEEFYHTVNTLYQSGRQIVLASSMSTDEIPQLEERLVSRFNRGLVARIDRPCYETRMTILKQKAARRGIGLPDPIIRYIAGRTDASIRELEGAITKMQAVRMLQDAEPTLELAQQALGESKGETTPQLSIQNIVDVVARFYGVTLTDLESKRRGRSIAVPRQVCMYLARERARNSLEEIASYFGGRDHITVMHASKTIGEHVARDGVLARQVQQIEAALPGEEQD